MQKLYSLKKLQKICDEYNDKSKLGLRLKVQIGLIDDELLIKEILDALKVKAIQCGQHFLEVT